MAEIKGARTIMYIGKKPKKIDNVNNNMQARVWNGLGDLQRVTMVEANNLGKHPDIWADVTDWPPEQRIGMVNKIREKIRAENAKHEPKLTVENATIDQLLARVRDLRDINDKLALPDGNKPRVTSGLSREELTDDDGLPRSRPESTEAIVNEIVGVIMQLDSDKPELFDGEGNPAKEAVESMLGYSISVHELNAALRQLSPATE